MPGRATRSWLGPGIFAALELGYVLFVCVLIFSGQEPGEGSIDDLAAAFNKALEQQDQDAVSLLIAYPDGDPSEYSSRYLAALEWAGAHRIRVTVSHRTDDRGTLTVSAIDSDGTPVSYREGVEKRDGRRFVEPLPRFTSA